MVSARTADSPDSEAAQRWASLARATGVTGLGAVSLLFAAVIAVSTVGEPPLDASSQEAAAFFRNSQAAWVQAAEATASLAMLVFLWFVVGLTLLLRRVEGQPPWRSTVALGSGILVAAYGVLDASWDAAAHRSAELGPGLAGYAFDVGNIGFANAWLAMASLAVSAGWVTISTGVLPRWTGWCAIRATSRSHPGHGGSVRRTWLFGRAGHSHRSLKRGAAEADLVAVGVSVDHLAHPVAVRLL
ncbi:MAG TPA: hypothetical protein VK204_10560 [Nocardioidaceae bacterium]|nr:hypothetical protein [Nocardioidaceae bacterium]